MAASLDCAQDKHGFTLVELLVVISIIAILSVIGITVFSGVQKGARDARRKADIDAIANAMEVHKGDAASGTTGGFTPGEYVTLKDSFFASGKIPVDPKQGQSTCGASGNKACIYCDRSSTVSQGGTDPGAGSCVGYLEVGDPNYSNYSGNEGFNFGYYTWRSWPVYRVCTNLESGNPDYYCKSNQQ